ncbi:MAG: aldo/keto reductase [Gemmataceae bacterium]|nr:aldo/keto reductase [Gemmataceae bacterium]
MLPTRKLGKTSLDVTALSIGCAPLGNMPDVFQYEVAEAQALDVIRAAFASPINFLDTAASYGDGESERRIGLVVRELKGVPMGYVLATKADRDLKTNDFSGDQMKRSVERSLKLLGLDRIQLMHLHDPEWAPFDQLTAKGGALEVLLKYREQGVIQHLGLGGGPIDVMMRYVDTDAFEAIITHNRYTLLNRSAEPLLAQCVNKGIGIINAAPYGSGVLAKGPENYPRYCYQEIGGEMLERIRKMDALCKKHSVPLGAAALQFSTRDPRIHSTIVGFSKIERIQQTVDWLNWKIPAELWAELDAVGFDNEDPETNRWK